MRGLDQHIQDPDFPNNPQRIRTQCNVCGAQEGTRISIGAKCFFCKKGVMELIE